ncbi:MAG: nickel-dependent hydrogenase large subunit [Solirubrobacteraceae bacterium]|jgi:Ni,Fe-hydrogenase I large subunit
MAKIKIDPVTRIEGHLRIEAEVSGGKVSEAWASGTMFRGIETIVEGKDAREAWIWAQRICGVCTTVHAIASVRAVEDAIGAVPPPNAELVRNLIAGSQLVHDHVIHFYHLHALDWVDIVSALKANPAKASSLAQSISDYPNSGTAYFEAVLNRLKPLAQSGQLSLFASGYWGHPAYRLTPEENLVAVAHYLDALEWQRDVIRIHAVLGGKNPHPQTFVVGGMATPIDLTSPQAINPERIGFLQERITTMAQFVEQVYIPDVLLVASAYPDWTKIGGGTKNFLTYGGYGSGSVNDTGSYLYPRGIVRDLDLSTVAPMDQAYISEQVARSWYTYSEGEDAALHPYNGETNPKYTGPAPPYQFLLTDSKYSWLKAPRYDGEVMEVGPLARMLVAYAAGVPVVKQAVDATLKKLGAGPAALYSTLGRVAARALDAQIVVNQLQAWLNQLERNANSGDLRIADTSKWDPSSWPSSARGFGPHEVPRGSLGHWVEISGGTISRYQAVVPSTWNASPRDAQGQPGPYEQALVGTPVADPTQPLELLRTVHSFDPCLACAVHVLDAEHSGQWTTTNVEVS